VGNPTARFLVQPFVPEPRYLTGVEARAGACCQWDIFSSRPFLPHESARARARHGQRAAGSGQRADGTGSGRGWRRPTHPCRVEPAAPPPPPPSSLRFCVGQAVGLLDFHAKPLGIRCSKLRWCCARVPMEPSSPNREAFPAMPRFYHPGSPCCPSARRRVHSLLGPGRHAASPLCPLLVLLTGPHPPPPLVLPPSASVVYDLSRLLARLSPCSVLCSALLRLPFPPGAWCFSFALGPLIIKIPIPSHRPPPRWCRGGGSVHFPCPHFSRNPPPLRLCIPHFLLLSSLLHNTTSTTFLVVIAFFHQNHTFPPSTTSQKDDHRSRRIGPYRAPLLVLGCLPPWASFSTFLSAVAAASVGGGVPLRLFAGRSDPGHVIQPRVSPQLPPPQESKRPKKKPPARTTSAAYWPATPYSSPIVDPGFHSPNWSMPRLYSQHQ